MVRELMLGTMNDQILYRCNDKQQPYIGYGGFAHTQKHKYVWSRDHLCIDDIENFTPTKTNEFTANRKSLAFFATTRDGPARMTGILKIFSAKVTSPDGNYDLIPVRVGSEGFMFDKISRQFFANAGTGNFIIGPDM